MSQSVLERLESFNNLLDPLSYLFENQRERICYTQVKEDRQLNKVTYGKLKERLSKIREFLVSKGVGEKEFIPIISGTRPEWMETDLAILSTGGVTVSVYPSLSAQEIGYILFDTGARIVVAENEEILRKLLDIIENGVRIPEVEGKPCQDVRLKIETVITFEDTSSHPFVIPLKKILSSPSSSEFTVSPSINRDSLASIVYTSGTTGPQKGVIQTHGNHLANLRQAYRGGLYNADSTLFLFLPFAHSFAKLMGFVGFLTEVRIDFPRVSDRKSSKINQQLIMEDISSSDSKIIPVVPRILEKMKEEIIVKSRGTSFLSKLIAGLLQLSGQRYEAADKEKYNFKWALYSPLRSILRKKLFGKGLQYVISGGAKLSPDVNRFFAQLDIEILQGYGLTETCVATHCNRPFQNKIGTVGKPLDGDIEVKIEVDGEILIKGPNVSKGYLNRPIATSESFDPNGWFHTGDLGSISEDNYLSITGRKKELIVTAGGKKISPEKIEKLLEESPLVSQAYLYGDGRQYCVALLVIQRQNLSPYLPQDANINWETICEMPEIIKVFEKEVEKVNSTLASFETVKKFKLISEEFSIDNGLLTPTLKLKRNVVAKRYEPLLSTLY